MNPVPLVLKVAEAEPVLTTTYVMPELVTEAGLVVENEEIDKYRTVYDVEELNVLLGSAENETIGVTLAPSSDDEKVVIETKMPLDAVPLAVWAPLAGPDELT